MAHFALVPMPVCRASSQRKYLATQFPKLLLRKHQTSTTRTQYTHLGMAIISRLSKASEIKLASTAIRSISGKLTRLNRLKAARVDSIRTYLLSTRTGLKKGNDLFCLCQI